MSSRARKYLQGLPYVDRKRIGIWGGSYGGLMMALALARNSDIFAAGVDFHGVHDWSVLIASRNGEDAPDSKEAVKLAFDSSPVASVAAMEVAGAADPWRRRSQCAFLSRRWTWRSACGSRMLSLSR